MIGVEVTRRQWTSKDPMWADQGDFPLTGYNPFTFLPSLCQQTAGRHSCAAFSSSCHIPSERRRGEGPGGVGEGVGPAEKSATASIFSTAIGLCCFCAPFDLCWGETVLCLTLSGPLPLITSLPPCSIYYLLPVHITHNLGHWCKQWFLLILGNQWSVHTGGRGEWSMHETWRKELGGHFWKSVGKSVRICRVRLPTAAAMSL